MEEKVKPNMTIDQAEKYISQLEGLITKYGQQINELSGMTTWIPLALSILEKSDTFVKYDRMDIITKSMDVINFCLPNVNKEEVNDEHGQNTEESV